MTAKTEPQTLRLLHTYGNHRGGLTAARMRLSQATHSRALISCNPAKPKPQQHRNHLWN